MPYGSSFVVRDVRTFEMIPNQQKIMLKSKMGMEMTAHVQTSGRRHLDFCHRKHWTVMFVKVLFGL